jgi:hypothetical protein
MKTIALLFLLIIGLVSAAGCHHHYDRQNYSDGHYNRYHYSDGYYRR